MICKCSWRKKAVFFLNSGRVYIDSYLDNSSGLVHVHSSHNFPENLYPNFLKHEEQASSSWFLDTHLLSIYWFCTKPACSVVTACL